MPPDIQESMPVGDLFGPDGFLAFLYIYIIN
jgi:hypothetical protein